MKHELEAALKRSHPVILQHLHAGPRDRMDNALRIYGIQCADGWFLLIDQLCVQLQAEVDAGRIEQPVAVQVKQKYGGLRFYVSAGRDLAHDLIAEAEERSLSICEVCGAPGVLRWQRGVQTVCDDHAAPGSSVVDHEAVERATDERRGRAQVWLERSQADTANDAGDDEE